MSAVHKATEAHRNVVESLDAPRAASTDSGSFPLVWKAIPNPAEKWEPVIAPRTKRFPDSAHARNRSTNQPRKAFRVKKTDRIQLARQIIARVKKEIQEPRSTESVRTSMRGKVAPYSTEPASRLQKA